jgi:hypothetical protein
MIESWPVWWANALTLFLFLILVIGCWRIPESDVMADAPDRARWRDLRIWASVLVLVQLGIYRLFS